MDFGKKIKQMRTLLNLTQEELANRCELTKSYISQLENNKTSPSLATLEVILEVLGTNFSDFFSEEKEPQIVFTEEEQFVKNFDGYDITWLVPTSQRLMMEPILMEISPHCQSLEDTPHDGQEFGYVLDGQVEIVYGNKVEKCKKGQAFYIETNKSHYLRNCSNRNARLIWVSTPPTF